MPAVDQTDLHWKGVSGSLHYCKHHLPLEQDVDSYNALNNENKTSYILVLIKCCAEYLSRVGLFIPHHLRSLGLIPIFQIQR